MTELFLEQAQSKPKGNVIAKNSDWGILFEMCDENWNPTGYVFVGSLPDTHDWNIKIG